MTGSNPRCISAAQSLHFGGSMRIRSALEGEPRVIVVGTWTGREAQLLRSALRLSQRGFAAYLGVSERIVATWDKRGATITPRGEVQAILDTALANAPAEAKVRFERAMSPGAVQPQVSPLIPPAISTGLDRFPSIQPATDVDRTRSLSLVDAEQIELLAVELTAWDHARGGSLARIAAVAQARWAVELMRLPASGSVFMAVAKATAQLCLAAGFMAFDAQRHDEAHEVFTSALDYAHAAKDPRLEAKALSHQARQAIWCGDPDSALRLLEIALSLPELSGSEQAMLHAGRARAFAKRNDVHQTLAAVDAADRAFSRHIPEDTPAWMSYYDLAQHQGDTGHALFDLAVHGHEQAETITRLSAAAAGHDCDHARSQALSRAKLAAIQFACGDPEEALATAIPAVRQIGTLRSKRALASLDEIARYAYPYRKAPGADQLAELIREETR